METTEKAFVIKRKCSCCEEELTNDNVKVVGSNKWGCWYNCPSCGSTMIETDKDYIQYRRDLRKKAA